MPGAHPHHRGRRVAWAAVAVVGAAFIVSAVLWGLPWSRDRLAMWIIIALLATGISNLRHTGRRVLIDWGPLLGLLFAYDLLRGYADDLSGTVHVMPQLNFDRWLTGGVVPTVVMQDTWYSPGNPHWWDIAAWVVYMSHFFMGLLVAGVVWRVAYHRFHDFIASFVTLTLAGFVTYAAFPAAPPWMASRLGSCNLPDLGGSCMLEPTTRVIPQIWRYVGVEPAAALFENGSRYANDVAAVPSLHAAYPMLFLLIFWASANWPLRLLLAAYPLAMGLTLIYSAEHYVADILLGWLYAVAAVAAVSAVVSRTSRRSSVQGEPAPAMMPD